MSSSESKATPSEPEPSSTLTKSFADRLTFPSNSKEASSKPDPTASSFQPSSSKFNWADEVTTPVKESDSKVGDGEKSSDAPKPQTEDMSQADGSTTWLNGSEGLDEPEWDVDVKLADQQADPDNPLYSTVTSFHDLNLREEILRGLSVMNFRKPSKIQEAALPLLMKEPAMNLIGQSQSGTGKTAAFVLNMLSRVDLSTTKPQAIVLAPTRELAKQIAGVCAIMGAFLKDAGLIVAEAIPNPRDRNAKIEGQIVVGTPGTTMDMMKRRQLETSGVKVLTLDEADNMLDMSGMGDQCIRCKRFLHKDVQTVLFSATFPEEVLKFASQFAPNSNQITLRVEQLTVKGIKQMYIDVNSDEEKYNALVKFYGLMTIASSIIFVKRRDTAAEIERRMTAEGHIVASLTGALEGAQRDEIFQKFRRGEAKVLITTNVLARGIDVQTVTFVINYDIPELPRGGPDYETYLHRIGRTGRFGRTGAALSFVSDKRSWQSLMAICKHFQVDMQRLDTSNWDLTEDILKAVMKGHGNRLDTVTGGSGSGGGGGGGDTGMGG